MIVLKWSAPEEHLQPQGVENPTSDDIRDFLYKLNENGPFRFFISHANRSMIRVIYAIEDRVMVDFPGVASLCDPEYLHSKERVHIIGLPSSRPYKRHCTVRKEVALEAIIHFIKTGQQSEVHAWCFCRLVIMRCTSQNRDDPVKLIEHPSVDEISDCVSSLDVSWPASISLTDQGNRMLIVSNTTEDRVHIRFWGKTTQRQSRSAVLLDPAYANSDKELDVLTDLEGGPYLFHETVEKNVAIQVLAYFVENGSLPSDYMWGAYGESLDEFIG